MPNSADGPAAIGAQVFGFRPSNEVDESRTSVAAYLDVEGDLLDWLRFGAAARTERYSDFGSTVDGKVTMRVRANRYVIVRGSLSTGCAPVARAVVLLLNRYQLHQTSGRVWCRRVTDATGEFGGGAGAWRAAARAERSMQTRARVW